MDVVEIGLKFTYLLLIVTTVAAVVMPLYQSIKSDPKSLLKSALGFGFVVLVYGIGYAISGNEVTSTYTEFGVDEGLSKIIGGLLITVYILMFLAMVGILFTEIGKIAK